MAQFVAKCGGNEVNFAQSELKGCPLRGEARAITDLLVNKFWAGLEEDFNGK